MEEIARETLHDIWKMESNAWQHLLYRSNKVAYSGNPVITNAVMPSADAAAPIRQVLSSLSANIAGLDAVLGELESALKCISLPRNETKAPEPAVPVRGSSNMALELEADVARLVLLQQRVYDMIHRLEI